MRRISIQLSILLACLVAAPLRLAAQQPQYTVVDLGTIGGTFSLAGGLSNSDWVEGFSTVTGDPGPHAVLWRDGTMTDLRTLGGPFSVAAWRPGDTGNAAGGSETGAVDAYSENFCGFGDNLICVPFFWRNSTKKMTALPTLGGNNGFAAGINNPDTVTGEAENTTPEPSCAGTTQVFQFEPVLWIKGQVQALPTFPGDPVGEALSINDRGQATGWSGTCTASLHTLLWQNGKATDLGNLGGTFSQGVDINNQGQVVGISFLTGDAVFHAFLWRKGVMTDLGTLPGDVSSSGDGINNKGQVVGGSFDASGNSRAYIWQNGVMTDLNTLIPAGSPLYLLEATGTINARGQIAGIAFVISTGEVHAFLATPRNGEAVVESAATAALTQRPKITLPENVRKLLQRQGSFGRFKGGLIKPQ